MKHLINISNILKWALAITALLLAGFYLKNINVERNQPCHEFDSKTEALQLHCWEQVADKIAKSDGVSKGFAMLSVYQSQNKKFGESCHEYMHQLGHYGSSYFWDYKNGSQINIPAESKACGYGFYHGLMAGVMSSGASIVDANNFCLAVEKSFGEKNAILLDNCYHGIGHSFEYGKVNWENPKKDLEVSINKCKMLGDGEKSCVRAMFGDLLSRYISDVLIVNDPDFLKRSIEEYPDMYEVCKLFPDFRQECISAFYSYGIDTSKSLAQLLGVVNSVTDRLATADVIKTIARTYSRKSSQTQNLEMVKSCESLVESNRISYCLTGLLMGKIETVIPEKGKIEADLLCQTPGIKPETRFVCISAAKDLEGNY